MTLDEEEKLRAHFGFDLKKWDKIIYGEINNDYYTIDPIGAFISSPPISERHSIFVFTDTFLIVDKNTIRYSEIQQIFFQGKDITIFTRRKAFGKEVVHGKNISLDIYNKIIEAWFPISPYMKFNHVFEQFALKYNLLHKPIEKDLIGKTTLSGKINNYNFSLSLEDPSLLSKLIIKLECDNEEDNYFTIRPEKGTDTFKKIFGMQDYKIGLERFDDYYVIQGNRKAFFKFILQKDIIRKMENNMLSNLFGRILFGKEQELIEETLPKKRKRIDNILDEHLLEEYVPKEIERKEKHTSNLIYYATRLEYDEDITNIAKHIIEQAEGLILLAQKINEYNNIKTK